MFTHMTDARVRLILSGIMGIALTGVMSTLYLKGDPVPTELYGFVAGVWGFFTGHVFTNGTGAAPKPPKDGAP